MILFAFEAYDRMAAALKINAHLSPGRFCAQRFENGELHVEIRTPVAGEHCLILGSIAPPDSQMLSVLLLAHTLKKEGAQRVTAILPYLAYARHDKDKLGESLASAWVGGLVRASGIDRVIAVDVHSERARALFAVPVVSLSPAEILAQALVRYGLKEATIVAPDEGAVARCQAVRAATGGATDAIPYFRKQRTATGITHSGPIGKVGRRAVIVDDILDTGGTLLSACEKLRDAGADDITIAVTHGLFTGDRWKMLWQLGVTRIFCTDSVPLPADVDANSVVQLSVIPLIARELSALTTTPIKVS